MNAKELIERLGEDTRFELYQYKAWNIYYVYFLLLANDIVYVGKTNDLGNRLASHVKNLKDFDEVWYSVTQNEQEALLLERKFIEHLSPKLNIRHKPKISKKIVTSALPPSGAKPTSIYHHNTSIYKASANRHA